MLIQPGENGGLYGGYNLSVSHTPARITLEVGIPGLASLIQFCSALHSDLVDKIRHCGLENTIDRFFKTCACPKTVEYSHSLSTEIGSKNLNWRKYFIGKKGDSVNRSTILDSHCYRLLVFSSIWQIEKWIRSADAFQ
jgi:hypothetical protein